jgi:TolB-like protein
MIGRTVSHYTILEQLGAGGMGVVYKAQDLTLDRPVALKFLPPKLTSDPEAKARFVREARAASALQHQNICTVHAIEETDDGQIFIVMDWYEGETLEARVPEGGMDLGETLTIALQVAEGLAEAHARGVVHRDIKPGNILITKSGVVKILDFGLAKLAAPTTLTKAGTTVGTLTYMSPEQARGGEVTHQTDIWSLGVVLYEMLTGKPPFAGEYDQALFYSIIGLEPAPVTQRRPDLPHGADVVLQRALAKEPGERYQDMHEFIAALSALAQGSPAEETTILPRPDRRRRRWPLYVAGGVVLLAIGIAGKIFFLSSGQETGIHSLAVLPLRATSSAAEAEPFADGMSEALITELSKVRGLVVKSWTSVRQYRERERPLPEIARELDADAVIEGSTELRGDRVGIRVRLIRAHPEEQLWAQDYIEDFRDVLALEGQIAREVVREVRVVVTPEERARLGTTRAVNAEAQMAYFLGRYEWNKWTAEGFQKSLSYFREAVAIDSSYALGYAGIADVFGTLWYMGIVPFDSVRNDWRRAARKAVELDEQSGEAHVSLAATRLAYNWDWEGAEEEMRRALALSPGYATGHHWHALMLSARGRHDEAIGAITRAEELDPRSAIIAASAGWTYLHARRYGKAIGEFARALALDSLSAPAYSGLGEIYELTGNDRKALANYLRVVELTGGSFSTLHGTVAGSARRLRAAFDRGGWKAYWSEQLAELQPGASAYHIASVYARLGRIDEAFRWLEKAVTERSTYLLFLNEDPVVRTLKSDPRFAKILGTIGLRSPGGS